MPCLLPQMNTALTGKDLGGLLAVETNPSRLFDRGQRGHGAYALPPCNLLGAQVLVMDDLPLPASFANAAPEGNGHVVLPRVDVA